MQCSIFKTQNIFKFIGYWFMGSSQKTDNIDYDSPWKEILELYLQDFMEFYFPQISKIIDWDKPLKFLDKELEKIVRDAKLKRRIADKVVEVALLNGKSMYILIHIEYSVLKP